MTKANLHRGAKPRAHKADKPTFFDPLVYVLDRIKAHFDDRAYIHKETGTIVYYQETGERITLGYANKTHLAYRRAQCFLTRGDCIRICKDLGLLS